MLDINKIYQGDCLDLLNEIDDNSVDLIIADPPYGIEKDFGVGQKWGLSSHTEWFEWMKKWLMASKRVLKPNGSLFVYGIHHNIGYIQAYLYEIGLYYGRMFIWHYENNWSMYSRSPAATYEPLLWFYKGNKYTYHKIREPYKSIERLKHKITKNGKIWEPNPDGRHGGDVWTIPTLAGRRFANEKVNHPTQKPLALCDRIIKHFTNTSDLILIPFAGSGSECVSAFLNKRNFIGLELNPKYVKTSEERLKKAGLNDYSSTSSTFSPEITRSNLPISLSTRS